MSVMLGPCIFCCSVNVLFILFVVCLAVFVNCLVNNSPYVLVWLQICCLMLWKCLVWLDVLSWIDSEWSSKECVCCACDPSVHPSVPSICFVYVFICRRLSHHLGV